MGKRRTRKGRRAGAGGLQVPLLVCGHAGGNSAGCIFECAYLEEAGGSLFRCPGSEFVLGSGVATCKAAAPPFFWPKQCAEVTRKSARAGRRYSGHHFGLSMPSINDTRSH